MTDEHKIGLTPTTTKVTEAKPGDDVYTIRNNQPVKDKVIAKKTTEVLGENKKIAKVTIYVLASDVNKEVKEDAIAKTVDELLERLKQQLL